MMKLGEQQLEYWFFFFCEWNIGLFVWAVYCTTFFLSKNKLF